MSLTPPRLSVAALLFLLVGGLVGGLLGPGVQADAQGPEDELWTFSRVLALVEDQYVGEADTKDLVEHAIEGMLGTLDPHSNYLDAEAFTEMRDEQRGKFHGLGIQITKRGPDKPLTIIAPIDGTPASRAGLLSGDIISEIEGEPTIDMTVQEAVRLLKGDKGTKVTITIQRPSTEQPFQVTIERDEIPIQSIRVTYMLPPDVGVVRIANFNTTTADELDAAMTELREQGMQRLILDLRGNPGGLLDQAVQVAERFLPEGKLIVYTRGRINGSNQNFVTKRAEGDTEVPLVVLVDHASASASEIVSGAIQDHDRGLVVGETTFGKGLVQRVIPLRDGGALAVTTAKYYTPAGRLIQRDYSDLDDYYFADPDEEIAADGGASSPAPETAAGPEGRDVFYTASGRKVYGGGGINPDYVVKAPEFPDLLFRLRRENQLFDYAVSFVATHPDLQKDFAIDEPAIADFKRFLQARGVSYEDEEFEKNRDMIAVRLRAQIVRIKWDQVEESRVIAEADPQLQRALELLPEAARLARRAADLDSAGRSKIDKVELPRAGRDRG
jgi:carboxyl-terminal processing protease